MDLQTAFDRGFEMVKSYVDERLAEATPLPPELAEQIASAVRLLHESPDLVEVQRETLRSARVTRIERDADGNFVPVYDEPQP